jgi:DNA invertase Pin-like site-specific DNA recombinase
MLDSYMCVSSVSDRQRTDLQRDALLAVGIDARHLFEDHASDAKHYRPCLAKVLSFVCPGDVLVVWKLDRLGRSLSNLLSTVTTLKDRHVAVRSLTEGMGTTTASGELLFHLFGALVQYEHALIQEPGMAGLAAAKRLSRIGDDLLPSLASSGMPSLPHWTAVSPRPLCAATSASSARP